MQLRSEETRTSLMEAALKRFALEGYDAASVDAICSEAGVSKGAFYHHFPSKQAIFLALFEGWLQSIETGMESARQGTVLETLLHMTDLLPAVFAAADAHLLMFLEFWLQASRDEELWNRTIAPYHRFREYFAGLIEQGIREGSLKPVDPQAAAHLLVSLAVGQLLQSVLETHDAGWTDRSRSSMELFIRSLAV